MHEHAVILDVLGRVEELARAEGAARVTRVNVRLGALSHFTPEHFREHFEDVARGTAAEGAVVDALLEGDVGDARAGAVVVETVELEYGDEGGAT